VNDFSGGQCSRTAEKISAHQEMRPPVKIHFTSRQVAAIYALRITLYDTNLFVADATPTRKRRRVANGE
jgi:hypothetical protein